MMPIKELLNKIKWDQKEKKEDYEISYVDRISKREIRINYTDIKDFDNEFFQFGDTEIPLHRVRKVYKNGKLVWERK